MKTIFLSILLILSYACNKNSEDVASLEKLSLKEKRIIQFHEPAKLISYVDDNSNGFTKTKQIGNITYNSVLKPIDYLLAKKRIDDNNTSYEKTDFEDLQYFDLRIKVEDINTEFLKYGITSIENYKERVDYCAFKMQNDITLIDGDDTLNCVLFHFERAFDITPYGHFILGFENKTKKLIEPKILCFNDKLFNNGIIKFTYTPSFLAKEPVLL